MSDADAGASRSTTATLGRFALGLAVGLVGGTALSFVVGIGYFVLSGGPLANEWICSANEYPASNPQGGSSCFRYGEHVPHGWTADPDGNGPLE